MKGVLPIIILLGGCSTIDVNENRAGCTFIDGDGRYGTPVTQYVKGATRGVYAHVGSELLKYDVNITCSDAEQSVKVKGKLTESETEVLPEWKRLE